MAFAGIAASTATFLMHTNGAHTPGARGRGHLNKTRTSNTHRLDEMMDTPRANLVEWTTEELLGEVLSRSAGDRAALDRVQVTAMRAILDDCDERGEQPDHWHARAATVG